MKKLFYLLLLIYSKKSSKKFADYKNSSTFAPQKCKIAGLWCNGNTADFGSVILGSSPSRPTKKASLWKPFLFISVIGNLY